MQVDQLPESKLQTGLRKNATFHARKLLQLWLPPRLFYLYLFPLMSTSFLRLKEAAETEAPKKSPKRKAKQAPSAEKVIRPQ